MTHKKLQLAPQYDHHLFEERIYKLWEAGNYFLPNTHNSTNNKQFVIVIPPPNVTGVLHMGHGLNISIQDICIRYKRMCGYATLWVPGTDHAGIATQHIVEQKLREQKTSRAELGREKFIAFAQQVSREHHAIITKQIKRMGASCDWSREAFTLDEQRSHAVRETFVRLYEMGLLYRGEYLVNWCPHCRTALSDDEVNHENVRGSLYTIRYSAVDGGDGIVVVTTRPETLLGDQAVVVHPKDARYTAHIGKRVLLPLVEKEIPIIADSYIDMEFGSGALKLTPAHDINDFEIAKRHDLPIVNILTKDGTLNENVPKRFQGLSIKDARSMIVDELKERGLLLAEEPYDHQVGHCYRCNTIIEPLLSKQWFVKMKPLAKQALQALQEKEIQIYPNRWESTYTHWLNGIRDWCISRQLWWGHRIPVWYDVESGEMIVSREDPRNSPQHAHKQLAQDEDVLDTWFSSWLWPFSTMGWPNQTSDLEQFYPTSTLITGYDIIFFWVARMIMAGKLFTNRAPFKDIFLTGLIRDKQGKKMSKSLGNGIDPLDIADSHGADALKFSLTYMMANGQDIRLQTQDFAIGTRFANKIWNAGRFILLHAQKRTLLPAHACSIAPIDDWIYHQLNAAIVETRAQLDRYRFSEAAHAAYDFFWNDFCDWYVEINKLRLESSDEQVADSAFSHLLSIFEEALRLLHPFISFITEELYQVIKPLLQTTRTKIESAICIAPYPRRNNARVNSGVANSVRALQSAITNIRTIRSEFSIPPQQRCAAVIVVAQSHIRDFFKAQRMYIEQLTGSAIDIVAEDAASPSGVALVAEQCEVMVDILDLIDKEKQIKKLNDEQIRTKKQLSALHTRLADNSPFLKHARPDVVRNERTRLQQLEIKTQKLAQYLRYVQQ